MFPRRQRSAFLRDWAVVTLGLTAIGVAVYFIARPPGQKEYRLTITAGRASGQRHEIAEIMAREARRAGLDARVQETAGSEEALDQVNEGKLQVALVQGGLGVGSRGNIRQVAALYVEPLHLLVKSELFPAVSKNLAALKGRVVNLSEPGSGTHTLSLEVLRFAGLTPGDGNRPGDFTASTLGYKALLSQTNRDKLPDAVFMVQSLPSPVARHLITRRDFRIVPLTFAEAFSLDALSKLGEKSGADAKATVEKSYVYDTVI